MQSLNKNLMGSVWILHSWYWSKSYSQHTNNIQINSNSTFTFFQNTHSSKFPDLNFDFYIRLWFGSQFSPELALAYLVVEWAVSGFLCCCVLFLTSNSDKNCRADVHTNKLLSLQDVHIHLYPFTVKHTVTELYSIKPQKDLTGVFTGFTFSW